MLIMTNEYRAREAARWPYTVVYVHDEYTTGGPVIVLKHPELPGCLAQGVTFEEAWANLEDARYEYILSLLEDGLPLPVPQVWATHTGVAQGCFYVFNAAATQSTLPASLTLVGECASTKRD